MNEFMEFGVLRSHMLRSVGQRLAKEVGGSCVVT